MDNFSIIKTAAFEINSIDTGDVVKVAGLLDSLKNAWKKLWNRGYSERYNRLREEYSNIEEELQDLKYIIEEIDEAIADSDVGKYDIGVRKLKHTLNKVNQKLNNLQQSAQRIQPPEEIVDRYNRAQYDSPEFLEYFKRRFKTPDPRINITKSDAEQVKFNSVDFFKDISKNNIYWLNDATFSASRKIVEVLERFNFDPERTKTAFKMVGNTPVITDETRNAINQAIIDNGIICKYYPKEPDSEESKKKKKMKEIYFGQMEMGIKVEFTLPNTFYKFQAYVLTTDMKSSDRGANKISIGKFETVRMLEPYLSSIATDNNYTINKFSEIKNEDDDTILAVRGIEKTSSAFRRKLLQIAKDLSTNADWLAAVMSLESGFSPSIANFGNPEKGAVGLIQFMPNTAAHLLGMSNPQEARKKMQAMSDIEQLDYVRKFYEPFKGRLNSPDDVYMAAFWPAGVGKSSDFIIGEEGTPVYRENKVFDREKTGVITKRQVGGAIRGAIESAKGKRISVNDDSVKEKSKTEPLDLSDKKDLKLLEQPSPTKDGQSLQKPLDKNPKTEAPKSNNFTLVDIANYGKLETIIRQAIEENIFPKNSFNIYTSNADLKEINRLSYNLKSLIKAEAKIYKDKNNNYQLKCIAYGPKPSLYKAIESICNYQKINFRIG